MDSIVNKKKNETLFFNDLKQFQKFRDGKYRVLITTDVAARGLDIPEVDLVICCSPPKDYESYVHRSGRTGRAGRTGICVCFYKPQESNALALLERNTVSDATFSLFLNLYRYTNAESLFTSKGNQI